MQKTLVSIVITTCNRCKLLPRALNSVINQTYENIEIIIVDDCSSDITEEVIKNYQKQYSHIIYIKNTILLGANVSRNKGILVAKGEFIAGLDDDDEFFPQRIELLLNNYDDSFAFITSNNLISKENSIYKTVMPDIVKLDNMLSDNILMNQALIKKQRLLDVGLYDERLIACQDYDMWMRLILKYGNVKVIGSMTQIVHMDDDLTRISTNSRKKFMGYFQFYKKYKYLMNKQARQEHIFRIYRIKEYKRPTHYLPIKLLVEKLKKLHITKFTIYGAGQFLDDLYSEIEKMEFTINGIVDANVNDIVKYGHRVLKPDYALQMGENIFLIASSRFYPQMRANLERLNKTISNQELVIIDLS